MIPEKFKHHVIATMTKTKEAVHIIKYCGNSVYKVRPFPILTCNKGQYMYVRESGMEFF